MRVVHMWGSDAEVRPRPRRVAALLYAGSGTFKRHPRCCTRPWSGEWGTVLQSCAARPPPADPSAPALPPRPTNCGPPTVQMALRRMEYRPELIRFDDIKEETVTGKNHIYHAPDKLNRPIVLMRPRLENTKTYDRQIKFLIYLLEQASRIADERGEAADLSGRGAARPRRRRRPPCKSADPAHLTPPRPVPANAFPHPQPSARWRGCWTLRATPCPTPRRSAPPSTAIRCCRTTTQSAWAWQSATTRPCSSPSPGR